MAFLSLNGLTVPVASMQRRDTHHGGDRARSSSGRMLSTRTTVKRGWRGATTPQPFETAQAIIGLINGEGDNWSWDADTVSGKGRVATGSLLTRCKRVGADGADAPLEAAFAGASSHALNVSAATANVSVVTDTDGDAANWLGIDATISATSAHRWVGAAAVLVDMSATVNTIRAEARRNLITTAAASTKYNASVHLKGVGSSGSVRVRLQDTTNGIDGPQQTIALTDGKWTRAVHIEITTGSAGGGAITVRLQIEEATVDSGIDFAVDAIQLEALGYSTAYQGATSGALPYWDGTYLQRARHGLTLALWLRPVRDADIAQLARIVELTDDADAARQFSLRLDAGTAQPVRWGAVGADGVTRNTSYLPAGTIWDGAFHHVAGVYRRNPEAGLSSMEIYFDGVRVATGSLSGDEHPVIADIDRVRWGNGLGATNVLAGDIDGCLALPYPASSAMVAALAARTAEIPDMPGVEMSGDALEEATITVDGVAREHDYRSTARAGAFRTDQLVVSFETDEV